MSQTRILCPECGFPLAWCTCKPSRRQGADMITRRGFIVAVAAAIAGRRVLSSLASEPRGEYPLREYEIRKLEKYHRRWSATSPDDITVDLITPHTDTQETMKRRISIERRIDALKRVRKAWSGA